MNDVMIDIETMGTRSTSMIVQIGACYFDRTTGKIGNTFKVNVENPVDKFTVDWQTIKFWLEAGDEARKSITASGAVPIHEALIALSHFLKDATYIWSHATFDIPILMNALNQFDIKLPVRYTRMRDIRTLLDLAEYEPSHNTRTDTHHDALDDCKFQVAYCVKAMKKLKI